MAMLSHTELPRNYIRFMMLWGIKTIDDYERIYDPRTEEYEMEWQQYCIFQLMDAFEPEEVDD